MVYIFILSKYNLYLFDLNIIYIYYLYVRKNEKLFCGLRQYFMYN